MTEFDGNVLPLAEAIADGSHVDWDRAESSATGPDELRVIQQLRLLADVGSAARESAATWGPLNIRSEVGGGSFGSVFRAWDPRLQREVALKLLRAPHREDPLASSVVKEARLLAQIRHPNVVTVYGADVFDDRVGIWMEFITGRTLKEILVDHGPYGAQEAAVIGRDLCRALAAVHQRGFLHRDVKAQNVMREAGGRTVLMDFGAGEAVATASADLAGSPAYLAPEILEGAPPSPQSDIYSLGVLMYHLVSGAFPVSAGSLDEFRAHHRAGKRRLLTDLRPDLPASFVKAIDRATAAEPAERPESAGAFEALLDETLSTGELKKGTVTPRPSIGRWLMIAAAVVAVVAVAGVAMWRNRPVPAPAVVRNSVAVIPFKDLSAQDGNNYFGDGVTQDVVAHLGFIKDLRVISGGTVARVGAGRSAIDTARQLGAATVLDGTIQRSADRVRLSATLIDASSGEQIWTEAFERDAAGIFQMQSEASRKIAIALKGELSKSESEVLAARRGHDFEAFNLYLKGRQAWMLRTEDGLNRSVQFHQQAIQRDPKFALAYAGLSDAYTSLGTYTFLPRADAYARAAEAAGTAVELDPSLAEAHLSLAYAQKNRFKWDDAEASFKRAIALKPGVAQAHHWYSIYLTQVGRFAEGIAEIKAALALDPHSIGANLQFATLLMMARRHEDAIAQWQHAIQLDASFLNAYRGISTAYAHLGLYERALDAAQQAAKALPRGSEDQELQADLGYVLAVAGRRAEALAIAKRLESRYRDAGETIAGSIAAIYSGLNDKKTALEWVKRAVDQRDPEIGYFKVDPKWDHIRSEPQFQSALAELGFSR
jgi:serine/threonine protein kinase/tetratricopeptide (TPR) repeat protein